MKKGNGFPSDADEELGMGTEMETEIESKMELKIHDVNEE